MKHVVPPILLLLLAVCPISALAEEEDEGQEESHDSSGRPPWAVLGELRLNGKFDVSYERHGFSSDPTDGQDAFRNYHHFLFLSRHSAKDPFFFTAELVDLSFYEFGAQFSPGGRKSGVTLKAKAGKLLVPFGSEPIFHHAYGGRGGFDQQVLPIIWSQLGFAGNVAARVGPIRISNDIYAVTGHALSSEEKVLNLQTDFAKLDALKVGFGNRLGIGWGPISAWYSIYASSIGYDRWLLLQAIDIGIWRIPNIPVIEDLALSFGVLRADVSGGGAGKDYYHFADYLTLRYYPWEFLYLQYRVGMRTMDNRRGFFEDDTRLDVNDSSSHNVGIVYSNGGVSLGLYAFFNLERKDEKDDDLLRFTVGYEF